MSQKIRFLDVGHEVIVKEKPPFFLGDELHARVKVRNLKAEHVEKRFCYILRFPGGREDRTMSFDLGPNEEKEYPLQPPYYLQFMGNFQIALLKGEAGTRFNEGGKLKIPPFYLYATLFPGNVRDRDGYELQKRTTKAVEAMNENSKNTRYLTITIAVLAAVEIICGVLRLVVG